MPDMIRSLLGLSALLAMATTVQAQTPPAATYAAAQAEGGRALYAASCGGCHGERLEGVEYAPPLTGDAFKAEWSGQSADLLFSRLKSTMPPGGSGKISDTAYAEIIAYLLQANGVAAGDKPLPGEAAALKTVSVFGK
jgi:mono/diheme cytochrome c family protein